MGREKEKLEGGGGYWVKNWDITGAATSGRGESLAFILFL